MKKTNILRALSLLLLVVLVTLTGCGGQTENPQSRNTDENTNETSETASGTTELKPDLPENVDMNGKTFTILVSNYAGYAPLNAPDLGITELNGDVLNDAAYNRDIAIQEKFNCVLKSVAFPDDGTADNALRKSLNAGDALYDIYIMRSGKLMTSVTSNYLTDLQTIPYLDFTKPWWNKSTLDALSFGKHSYAICGDVSVVDLLSIFSMYFNKQMLSNFGLENPYTLVNNGTWTVDKMYEMAKVVPADLNNDGKRDVNDRYGVTHILDGLTALLNAGGESYAVMNAQGIPEISFNTQSAFDKYIHITEMLSDHDTFFNAHLRSNPASQYEAGMFVNGQALFSLGGIYYAPEMRAMQDDFGIIPYPKYDVGQSDYHTPMCVVAVPFVTVPISNTDLNNTGIFLEEYAYQGRMQVLPAFYDILLQRKVARDEESSAMLDLIFKNIFIDVGSIYNFAGIMSQMNDNGCKGKTEIASFIEKITPKVQSEIDKLVAAMEK
ncbi:MAG: hypothetical protein FWD71_21885 [Oscillospiraceae bacterium]|nr:hypothetical protein [Oscillospiraceae bacterium]